MKTSGPDSVKLGFSSLPCRLGTRRTSPIANKSLFTLKIKFQGVRHPKPRFTMVAGEEQVQQRADFWISTSLTQDLLDTILERHDSYCMWKKRLSNEERSNLICYGTLVCDSLLEPPHGGPMKRLAISFPEEKKQPTTDYSEPQPETQRITSQCDQGSVRFQGHPLEN